jgi:hypothetical protein
MAQVEIMDEKRLTKKV